MRNNGRTSDIYRPNEAFVRPLVILPDILSGGVASDVEFRMSNPHPHTSQFYVKKRSFRCSRTKQTRTATRRHVHCTVACCTVCVFCQIPDVAATYTRWGSKGCVHNKNATDSHGHRDTCTVHGEHGRIGNSEMFACNVSCRGCKNLKMSRLIA